MHVSYVCRCLQGFENNNTRFAWPEANQKFAFEQVLESSSPPCGTGGDMHGKSLG